MTELRKSVGIAFIWNRHILLVHHPKSKRVKGSLGIPKGREEENEKGVSFATAIREVQEEVGIFVPTKWILDSPIYSVYNTLGRQIEYYIVNLENLSAIGLESKVVPPEQYQKEEVNWAAFMPFKEAWENIQRYQRPILERVGYSPFGTVHRLHQFYIKVKDKFEESNPLLNVFALENGNLMFYGYNQQLEIGYMVNFDKDNDDKYTYKSGTLTSELADIDIQVDKDYDFDSKPIIDYLIKQSDNNEMSDGGETINNDILLVYPEFNKEGESISSFSSISDYILKKLQSEGELYHKSESGSEYYTLNNFIKSNGEPVNLRISDHNISSNRLGLSNLGGADVEFVGEIKEGGKEGLEELNAWIAEFLEYQDSGTSLGYKKLNETPETEKSAIEEGTQIEMEHEETIKKLQSEDISVEEGARMIAQDHLDERSDYYEIVKRENLRAGGETKECDSCQYFDMDSLQQFGFEHPLYYIVAKDELHTLEFISPQEYLDRVSKNFGLTFDPNANYIGQETVKKYAQSMKDGDKFPIVYYQTNGKAQEGRHRALAVIKLGGKIMPVVAITKLSREQINNWALELKDKSFEEVDKHFKAIGHKGITHLGYENLQTHLQYRMEMGGVIEGQLHSECNEPHGCGEKFEVGNSGKIIEAERDEAVIVSKAFQDTTKYKIKGTCSQIASALNVMGGGKSFDKGAVLMTIEGKVIEIPKLKTEANDTDVEYDIEGGTIVINRRSMADPEIYEVSGTPREIASIINSNDGNGKVIQHGGTIKEA